MKMEACYNSGKESKSEMRTVSIGIAGKFAVGKNAIINSLLGRNILESYAIVNDSLLRSVKYGAVPKAMITCNDGSRDIVSPEDLTRCVAEISVKACETGKWVEYVDIEYPCAYLENNVKILALSEPYSYNILPQLDALILVLSAASPYSFEEEEFTKSLLNMGNIKKIIFVMNGINLLDPESVDACLSDKKNKIKSKTKIKEPEIYPYSASEALKGRMEGDEDLIKKSGFKEFEKGFCNLINLVRANDNRK